MFNRSNNRKNGRGNQVRQTSRYGSTPIRAGSSQSNDDGGLLGNFASSMFENSRDNIDACSPSDTSSDCSAD